MLGLQEAFDGFGNGQTKIICVLYDTVVLVDLVVYPLHVTASLFSYGHMLVLIREPLGVLDDRSPVGGPGRGR